MTVVSKGQSIVGPEQEQKCIIRMCVKVGLSNIILLTEDSCFWAGLEQ